MRMIEKNKTWHLVNKSKDKNIGLKWVYETKLSEDGSIRKHKARLVAKGYAKLGVCEIKPKPIRKTKKTYREKP